MFKILEKKKKKNNKKFKKEKIRHGDFTTSKFCP